MKQIIVENLTNMGEAKKLVSFISKDILSFDIDEDKIILNINDDSDEEEIRRKANKIFKQHLEGSSRLAEVVVFENKESKEYTSKDEIYMSDFVHEFGEGLLSIQNDGVLLLKYFNDEFMKMALKLGAIEKIYPVLLPMNILKKTGYIRTSPQYLTFCSSSEEDTEKLNSINRKVNNREPLKAILEEPRLALSPSACFSVYMDLKDKEVDEPKVYTICQDVFRNEGRFNWDDFARLRNYTLREFVFVGDMEFIKEKRIQSLEMVKEFVKKLNLDSRVCITYDPFVMPSMQKFKEIQISEETKFELQLSYSNDKNLAVASFNIHGDAFTTPFNIKVKNVSNPVTGCVGFGMERWVLAFLAQYGLNRENWPECVKKYIEER